MSISTDSDRYRVNDQEPCFSINVNETDECVVTAHLNATPNTNVELHIAQAVVTINKIECGKNIIIHLFPDHCL